MTMSLSTSRCTLAVCSLFVLLAGCGVPPKYLVRPAITPSAELQALLDRELSPDDALLIGAGDIAACGRQHKHALETAALVEMFPSAQVFAAGDDAYLNGSTRQFNNCYGTSWGSFKERTRPAPGNHEYGIYQFPKRHNATPYFRYFGDQAGPEGLGYYSYDLGGWHIVSLNSMAGQRGAPTMDEQVMWLKDDLAQTSKPCILAYWHHPLFSSGDQHGDQDDDPGRFMQPLWNVLLDHRADVILNGHDHHYEQFALQDATGAATEDGIRQIIVGTGGGEDRGHGIIKDNSEALLVHTYGVLLMTLRPDSYEWHFLKTDGTVGSGSQRPTACHPKPPGAGS